VSDERRSDSGRPDDIDRQILALLSNDARRSARSIAREIGMSPGAVSERVARLEEGGVIRGYHADIDPAALGYKLQVLIGLQTDQGPQVSTIVDELLALPEIAAVNTVTGTWDLVVVAHVRDHHHLREVLLQSLWSMKGFRHSETLLVLDQQRSNRFRTG
jgi:DNA-binding Lrp family transcriptional regulator